MKLTSLSLRLLTAQKILMKGPDSWKFSKISCFFTVYVYEGLTSSFIRTYAITLSFYCNRLRNITNIISHSIFNFIKSF